MIVIREARTTDIDGILKLGIECHAGAATRFTVDPVLARRVIANFVQSQSRFAWVVERDEELLGVLLGGIEPVWYSQQKEASDLLFYVRKDPRSVGAGRLLLKRFIRWGYERGADGFSMAVSYGGPTAATTGKIFRKLGFIDVGNIFYLQDKLEEKQP